MAITLDTSKIQDVMLTGNPIRIKATTDNYRDNDGNRRMGYVIIAAVSDEVGIYEHTISAEPDSSGVAWIDISGVAQLIVNALVVFNYTPDVACSSYNAPLLGIRFFESWSGNPFQPNHDTDPSPQLANYSVRVIIGGLSAVRHSKLSSTGGSFYDAYVFKPKFLQLTNIKIAQNTRGLRLPFVSNLPNNAFLAAVATLRNISNDSTTTIWSDNIIGAGFYSLLIPPIAEPGSYEITVKQELDDRLIVDAITLTVTEQLQQHNTHTSIVYRTGLGAYNVVCVTGNIIYEIDTQGQNLVTARQPVSSGGIVYRNSRATGSRRATINLGWRNSDENDTLQELLLSDDCWLEVRNSDGTYTSEPICIVPGRSTLNTNTTAPQSIVIEALIGGIDKYY